MLIIISIRRHKANLFGHGLPNVPTRIGLDACFDLFRSMENPHKDSESNMWLCVRTCTHEFMPLRALLCMSNESSASLKRSKVSNYLLRKSL